MKDLSGPTAHGMNNLLYSADADFSCFADLALVSPVDYYKEGQGSLMQVGAVETTVYCQLGAGGSGGGHWALQGGVVQPACPSCMHAHMLNCCPCHRLPSALCLLQCVLTPAAPYKHTLLTFVACHVVCFLCCSAC